MSKTDDAPKADTKPKTTKPKKPAAPKPPKAKASSAPYGGLTPMRLHVSGTTWQNNLIMVDRCGPTGEWAEKWLVRCGDKMLTTTGQPIAWSPFHALRRGMQDRVALSLEDAIELAKKQ